MATDNTAHSSFLHNFTQILSLLFLVYNYDFTILELVNQVRGNIISWKMSGNAVLCNRTTLGADAMSSFQKFWAFLPMILDHHNHIKTKTQVVHIELLGFFFWADFRCCPLNFSSGFSPTPNARPMCPLAFYRQKIQCFQWLRGEFESFSNEISERRSRCFAPPQGRMGVRRTWGDGEGKDVFLRLWICLGCSSSRTKFYGESTQN